MSEQQTPLTADNQGSGEYAHAMRTPKDRLRNTILFEITLLCTITPLLSYTLEKPAAEMGALSFGMCLLAMSWNYLYNVLFDHMLVRLGRPLYPRSFKLRTIHALLFEFGLLLVAIPIFMVVLEFSFWQAFVMELGFALGVPVIAVVYNYFYDLVFPPPLVEA